MKNNIECIYHLVHSGSRKTGHFQTLMRLQVTLGNCERISSEREKNSLEVRKEGDSDGNDEKDDESVRDIPLNHSNISRVDGKRDGLNSVLQLHRIQEQTIFARNAGYFGGIRSIFPFEDHLSVYWNRNLSSYSIPFRREYDEFFIF